MWPEILCIRRGYRLRSLLGSFDPLGKLAPREACAESILRCASCIGLGIGMVLTWAGTIPLSQWFRLILSLARVRSWFRAIFLATDASYTIVDSRQKLVLDAIATEHQKSLGYCWISFYCSVEWGRGIRPTSNKMIAKSHFH